MIGYIQVAPPIQSKPDKGSKLTYLVGIMASLAVVMGLIFQNRVYISDWFQYAVLLALVFIIMIIIYIFFSDGILIMIRKLKQKRMRNKVARDYYSELKFLSEKFSKLIESDDGITIAFNKLRSESETHRYLDLVDPQLIMIKALLYNMDKAISRFNKTNRFMKNADDFELIIDQFDAIINIYEKLYVRSTLTDIKKIASGVIPEKNKKDYKIRTDKYEKFMDKYIEFGERVNKEYGSNVVKTYFEKFEDL